MVLALLYDGYALTLVISSAETLKTAARHKINSILCISKVNVMKWLVKALRIVI